MKITHILKYKCFCYILMGLSFLSISSCDDYLDIPLPSNSLYIESGFSNDKSVAAVINGVLNTISVGNYFDGNSGVGHLSAIYTDEITNNASAQLYEFYYLNALSPNGTVPELWTNLYKAIYQINLAIEGIESNHSGLTFKNQWLGEAYFLRALFHFYLTSAYGDIPIAITSDYQVNNKLSRSSQTEVYEQVVSDLLEAQNLLPDGYHDAKGLETINRDRPNKSAATALLSRMYLFMDDWSQANIEATKVINKTDLYGMIPLDNVFSADSRSTIFGIAKSESYYNYVKDYYIYSQNISVATEGSPLPNSIYGYLTNSLLNSFEEEDQRLENWTVALDLNDNTYYIPNKYKSNQNGDEDIMMLRLAELYLIRAEAKVHLEDVAGAEDDVNVIRNRAGLGNVTLTDSNEALGIIMDERRHEFFTELGHRFFDLKRSKTIDAVMTIENMQKNGMAVWSSNLKNWPISNTEIQANSNLTQTQGY